MLLDIHNVLIVKTDIFMDNRGYFVESFNKKKYPVNFVQDNFSSSKKNVLRGFHGDSGTWKLLSCIYGKVQFAFINYNIKSKNFKKNINIILQEEDNLQILVPPKFGTANLILSNKAIIHYKQSTYHKQYKQFTINYKSKVLNFKWKSKKTIISKRDEAGIFLD